MTVRVSGGGQRVVAELGQDVMGLAEDLPGFGQRGPLAVAAVLDLGVVAVVRRRGPGVGLAGLVDRPAQHRRSLPGQPPGRSLAVGGVDGDVQPGRSEEHTSELQSRLHLVCRLLLEKKKNEQLAVQQDYLKKNMKTNLFMSDRY